MFSFFILGAILILLLGRAAYLQSFRGSAYRALAEQNRTRLFVQKAPRGVIYDAQGIQLAENTSVFRIFITPSRLPLDLGERKILFLRIADITNISPAEIDEELVGIPSTLEEPVPLSTPISYEQAIALYATEERLSGIHMSADTRRNYKETPLHALSHVLGYTGLVTKEEYEKYGQEGYNRSDTIGKQGLERYYESLLRGTNGSRVVEVNSYGREILLIEEKDPIAGANIHLSLDVDFMAYIEERLLQTLSSLRLHRAAVVVMDPRNGAIRALVSVPSYDNNAFSIGMTGAGYLALTENPDAPLFPRATSGTYPPGSTFKPVVAATALADGLIHDTTTFFSTGGLAIGQWFFPDWKAGGHGPTDVYKALAESVNTFFYMIGGGYADTRGLGIERIVEAARLFGFGSATGIDLPMEGDGFLPSKEWKERVKGERWYIGDTYHAAIGQGDIAVTPLQLALSTSVIANGGTLYVPHLVDWYAQGEATTAIAPQIRQANVATPEALREVRQGMRQAVVQGSARSLLSLPITVAGKTGTAQSGGGKAPHAWFTSFAPYENPELVVTVLVEEAGEGSSISAPIARDIYAWWSQRR